MPLSFAGVDLLLDWPDPDVNSPRGAVETWLDRFAPLEDLRLFGSAPVALADGRWAPRNPSKQAVGLATHNWSTPPRLRLNTLFWPATGASRWGYFVGLVDGARLDRIIAALDVSEADLTNKHGTLVISEGNSHSKRSLSTKMYLLPPRRIAVDARAGATKLWLLPLVDERYLWQSLDVAAVTAGSMTSSFTWSLFLGSTKLGSIAPLHGDGFDLDSISADYQRPDGVEFDRRANNLPLVLDAAAESIGMRVVRDFDGVVYFMASARSETRLQNSLGPSGLAESEYEVISGGQATKYRALRVPATCQVLFPMRNFNFARPDGAYHTVAKNYSDSLDAETLHFDANKVVYTSAAAEMGDDGTADNAADCTTLATRIARDFYAWLEQDYDITFAGIKAWQPNGFDDWLIYSHGGCDSAAGGEPVTRVMSVPYNFGASEQLQQFSAAYTPGPAAANPSGVVTPLWLREGSGLVRVKVSDSVSGGYAAGLGKGGTPSGELLDHAGNSYAVPVTVPLLDPLGLLEYTAGDLAWATVVARDGDMANPKLELIGPAMRSQSVYIATKSGTVTSSPSGMALQASIPLAEYAAPAPADRSNNKLASVSGNEVTINRSGWYCILQFFKATDDGASTETGFVHCLLKTPGLVEYGETQLIRMFLNAALTKSAGGTYNLWPNFGQGIGVFVGFFSKNDTFTTHFSAYGTGGVYTLDEYRLTLLKL